jgi:hypothetical protein
VKLRARFDSMLLYFRNSYNVQSVDLSMCVCVCVCLFVCLFVVNLSPNSCVMVKVR